MSVPLVLAHGIGARADLPLPAWLVAYAAAGVLVVSFAALAFFWPRPRLQDAGEGALLAGGLAGPARLAVAVGRVAGLALFAVVLVAAWAGDRDPAYNLAPTAFYVVFWVGLIVASGFVGDVWHALSPYETLASVGRWARGRRPYTLGHWPAAAGILAFAWLELCHPEPSSPRVVAVAITAYSLWVLGAAAVWGRRFLREGEAFAGLFGVLAAMAVLRRDDAGRLRARWPAAGLPALAVRPGTVALVLVALGTTTFDGVSRTSFWQDVAGSRTGWSLSFVNTLGMLWVVGLVALLYVGAMRVASNVTGRATGELAEGFAHSLVPIALAYAIAHYFSLLVFQGQASIALASDPLGRGWDLFGTASNTIDYRAVSANTISYVQTAAIVVGHVAGVVLAHDRAVAWFPKRRALRSQYPMLVAMVGYTVGGLLLLLGA